MVPTASMVTTLPPSEFRTRLAAVRSRIADADAAAAAFFSATSTERLTYYPQDLESNVVR